MFNSKFIQLYNLIMESIINESEGLTGRINGDKFFNEKNENESHTFISLEKDLTYDDIQKFLNTIPLPKLKLPVEPSKLIILSESDLDENYDKNEKFFKITFHDNNLNEDWYIIKRANNSDKISSSFISKHFNLRFERGKSSSLKLNAIDIFKSNLSNLTIDDIVKKFINYIKSFKLISDECRTCAINILKHKLNCEVEEPLNNKTTFILSKVEAAIIKNTLSEIYDPIYYIKTHKLTNANISFNTSKTGGLYDSLIITNNEELGIKNIIKISSKDKKGNTPSINSIVDYLDSKSDNINEQQYKNELKNIYSKQYEILKIIYDNSMYDGPLKLFNYLLTADKKKFKDYIQSYFSIDENMFDLLLNNLKKYINYTINHSQKPLYNAKLLHDFYLVKDQTTKSEKRNEHYNILSGISKCCVKYINDNEIYKTEFTNLFKAVLSSQNIIQIHFWLNEQPDKTNSDNVIIDIKHITFVEKVVDNAFSGNIILTAEKNYCSTQIKGKICFIIK